MAESRRGLGRGLSALLDEAEAATTPEARAAAGVEEIPIEVIRPNPHQPRRDFREEELDGLADSIRWKGVLTPILVRPIADKRRGGDDARYEIVAGERRWRAAQKAGLHGIPALVRDLDDGETLDIALIENIQRQDLNPIEEARAYKSWADRNPGAAPDTMGAHIGKSRSHIVNTMRLLDMGPVVLGHLAAGRITAGHARALAMGPDPEAMVEDVIARGLSVRDTEALARKASAGPAPPPKPKRGGKDADTVALEADLSEVLGLKVEVLDRGGAGEVRIRYATLEQLDDLCRRLTRVGG
jgi:ParB family chromosome partitioning protein